MTSDWAEKVEAFWDSADASDPESALRSMRALVDIRPPGDAAALYEWASVHDFLGFEDEAIPLYRAALAAGLQPEHRARATIQLASSLRNVGNPGAALDLLTAPGPHHDATGAAALAFRALALHDAGRKSEAVQAALLALAPTLQIYGRAVARYASELTTE
jgi:tetratricopeptide (TPR) repeat protein